MFTWDAGTLGRWDTGTLERWAIGRNAWDATLGRLGRPEPLRRVHGGADEVREEGRAGDLCWGRCKGCLRCGDLMGCGFEFPGRWECAMVGRGSVRRQMIRNGMRVSRRLGAKLR